MLKLTLPDGRAIWLVAAHISGVGATVDRTGAVVSMAGEPDPYQVLEDADLVAKRLAQVLKVGVTTAVAGGAPGHGDAPDDRD